MPGKRGSVQERLLRHVEYRPHPPEANVEGDCWIWVGAVNKRGYGKIRGADSQTVATHRIAYTLWREEPQLGDLDHLCRVVACCNPWHLEDVTHAENVRRGSNAQRTHCKRGHDYSDPAVVGYALHKDEEPHRYCRECARASRAALRRAKGIPEREGASYYTPRLRKLADGAIHAKGKDSRCVVCSEIWPCF